MGLFKCRRVVDYDATITENDSLGASSGILRNSNNRQTTVGLLSKLNYDVSSDLKAQVGIDYRSARIYHVKTIRDLLGGDYYMTSDSEFDSDNGQGGLGDPIDYNFTNYVNWLGLFGQVVLYGCSKNICHGWYDNCKIHTLESL